MNSDNITNVLIVGVGGQGVILASNILCEVALQSGYDVKKSEVHGMSQRGGVVTSHVRFGAKIYSALIASGAADAMLAFEASEAMRFAHEVKKGGTLYASLQTIKPPSGGGKKAKKYPDNPLGDAKDFCAGTVVPIDAEKIANELGNSRLTNTILLGALSKGLEIDENTWVQVISKMVPPKTIELNLEAFARGRREAQ
ncbi:MAG: indolepyruvate oxidoreductase subunit beta [Candidatus Electryonea clarkiae]|nr:indolepyruvate oxidoreductase subunit beta [Candidatus Electryonea clarkiae]MDP8288912.1 indolepyruvate oxidoreductase subunit beta [Candidatus Electryonea clarkiae]